MRYPLRKPTQPYRSLIQSNSFCEEEIQDKANKEKIVQKGNATFYLQPNESLQFLSAKVTTIVKKNQIKNLLSQGPMVEKSQMLEHHAMEDEGEAKAAPAAISQITRNNVKGG